MLNFGASKPRVKGGAWAPGAPPWIRTWPQPHQSTLKHARAVVEFFRIEFYRIYRICRKLFLVVLKMKINNNSLLQIL